MPGPSRETHLLEAVVALVDSLLDDFDVIDLLTELTEHCGHQMQLAAGAGEEQSRRGDGEQLDASCRSATETG